MCAASWGDREMSHSSVMPLIDGGRKGSSGGRDDGGMRWTGVVVVEGRQIRLG